MAQVPPLKIGAYSTELSTAPDQFELLYESIRHAKLRLLRMHYESGVGHIGGNLSCLDVLMTVFHVLLGEGDRFVLSKGHSAGALYVTLNSIGRIPDEELTQFHKNNTRLAGHPAPNSHDDIVFATGSLGHGLSLANGLALARQIKRQPGRVYCVLSDGELQEGSTWEALIFARHHNLPLTAIVDANGLQGFGSTAEVAGMQDIPARLRGLGVEPHICDGHSPESIVDACVHPVGFRVVVANTRKGNGVSFMENQMEWHYLPMNESQYTQAVNEVIAATPIPDSSLKGRENEPTPAPSLEGGSLKEAA